MTQYEWNVIEIIKYDGYLSITRENQKGNRQTINLDNRFIDMVKIIRDQNLNG